MAQIGWMVYSCATGMAEPEQRDEWLTISEIASELKLARETVRLWIVGGETSGDRRDAARAQLPATRVGYSWRVRRSDLEQMLASQRSLPESNPLTMATSTEWPDESNPLTVATSTEWPEE
jgi:hypothetical protein